jgi:thiosulfate dehydrogenase (quinone) large subunit
LSGWLSRLLRDGETRHRPGKGKFPSRSTNLVDPQPQLIRRKVKTCPPAYENPLNLKKTPQATPLQGNNGESAVSNRKPQSALEQSLILFFRLTIGWTFLFAAIHHFGDSKFVTGFLSSTTTFHDVYAPLTNEAIAPVLTFLVEYGHLLIGLSLISGLLVRASAPFAIMLMILYWTAHMDYPYIENTNNYLIDYHIVYAGVLVYLIAMRAGHVFGLDGLADKFAAVRETPALHWLVSAA